MLKINALIISSVLTIFANGQLAYAKLGNTVVQNQAQYGNELDVNDFSDGSSSFTGYRSYSPDSKWKLIAFFRNGKVRSEHLIPKKSGSLLNRNEVRVWADKMFGRTDRGNYRRKLAQYKVEGHFFDRGMVAYEYNVVNKKVKNFKGVKVLFYENNKKYYQINPKAHL